MGMLDKEYAEKEKAPRSVAEAKKQGKSTYTGKDGKQKAAVYKEDLGKGQSLKDYLNKGGGRSAPTKDSGNDYKAGNPNAVKGLGGLGISQTNRPRLQGTMEEGKKSFGYGYYDQNGDWISPREDMQDGYGPGGSGAKFGGMFGGLSNALGATGYGSGEEATGLAKFIQEGGTLGTMAKGLGKGIKGVAQNIKGAFKPASYTVKPGDNLSKIAAANNMTLEQLLAKNPGLDPKTAIQPKQQIKIGGLFGGTQTPEQAAANAAMMAQMDRTGNNNSVAAAPMGVQGVQCPPGQVFNPVTNSCEPAPTTMTAAAQTSMPTNGVPGIANPSYEQIIAYRNNPQAFAPAPVQMAAEGGIMSLVEAEGGNEKTLISDAIAAIESGAEDEAAAVALAKFVQVHGEDALRDLVEKVQSGDYADTRERFANGENGIVKGPGDGSGTDDKVPATIDGEKDVLLAAGEMVLRKKTTDALDAALGEGGLDAVNAAEGDAPAVLRRLMSKVQAERQTA
jgi:LysM repeat protein